MKTEQNAEEARQIIAATLGAMRIDPNEPSSVAQAIRLASAAMVLSWLLGLPEGDDFGKYLVVLRRQVQVTERRKSFHLVDRNAAQQQEV